MIELKGKYNTATVFTDRVEESAMSQIIALLNQPFSQGAKVRIMPDCHAGTGCVIGFTADLGDLVVPNLVGVDIGCGMYVTELDTDHVDFPTLDHIIHKYVPAGQSVHDGRMVKFPDLQQLHCYRSLKDTKRIERGIGSLGGGNHFIEVNQGISGKLYLVVHSGSRNLGRQVADHYQHLAIDMCSGKADYYARRDHLIEAYKAMGRKSEIADALRLLKAQYAQLQPQVTAELCYLQDEPRQQYLHDMEICQRYAAINRETIAAIILGRMKLKCKASFHTIHNYIDFKDNIIRKGSVAAYDNQQLIIPINMRDGSILAIGKGNADWNYSAPHGAGRLFSRSQAKANLSLAEFETTMNGIYTTSVNQSTLDESPMAYKPIEDILNYIDDTVAVQEIIKPVYNFKAGQ